MTISLLVLRHPWRVSRQSSMVSVLFLNLNRQFRRGLHAVASPALAPRDSHLHWPSETATMTMSGVVRIDSFQTDDVLVATPEPGTIGLFGLGLAGLAAKLRASRHRRVDRPR